MTDSVILMTALGAIFGFCVGTATEDWRASAADDEVQRCKDEPDRKAYMARLPGEAHTGESCIHLMRFGDPRWVPEFSHPLQPPLRPKG